MTLLAALTYMITLITATSGYSLDLAYRAGGCEPKYDSTAPFGPYGPILPPTTIAMSPKGEVAFVEHQSLPHCGEDRIVILKGNQRIIIPRPLFSSKSISGHVFSVSRLAITDDGTLFATLEDDFSGAYMGEYNQTFVRQNGQWIRLFDSSPGTASGCCSRDNLSLGAADGRRQFALNFDFKHEPGNPGLQDDPEEGAPSAVLMVGSKAMKIERGTVLAMRGRYAVGYVDGHRDNVKPNAILWRDGKRTNLGKGVAFDVDDDGDVVGDDADAAGFNRELVPLNWRPVLWHGVRRTRLSNAVGSAYAIRRGYFVGTVAGRAFIARRDAPKRMQYFDRLVRGDWKIFAAFAIARTMRVLALGYKTPGDLHVLILDLESSHSY